ncbi:MAG: LLM class flavin-dependent oxidoreductase [SAR324 cluster bacterium]|nr:LLM class flavin-dependent oxidoreductase [SAR324 cluster bacterium]
MKWGVFSLSQVPDLSRVPEAFDEDFVFFQQAEALGYDTIWIAEHLFSSYGLVTSTQVLAAAIAKATERIKIGTAVVVIPFNHPLRTASDFALVDILSHGRLLFGAGRAYQPHEFLGLGVPMDQSREMYSEGLDIVVRAWSEDKITAEGEFWRIAQPVQVLPKPIQKPHPPVYQACISPESFKSAAQGGWHLQLASPFTYRTYREQWIEKLAENLEIYERECEKHGRDPKAAERMLLVPFYVADSDQEARETFGKHVEWFYSKVTSSQQAVPGQASLVKGYELTMSESRKTLAGGYLSFEMLHKYGAAIAGNPGTCVEKLNHLRERLGITEFVLWFNIGGMPVDNSVKAMALAKQEVAPHVEAMAASHAAAD